MFSIPGTIAWFMGTKLGRYVGFSVAMVLVVAGALFALRRRDGRLIAADRIKSELKRQRDLNAIRKKQIAAANNRVDGDGLINSLRDDDKDF